MVRKTATKRILYLYSNKSRHVVFEALANSLGATEYNADNMAINLNVRNDFAKKLGFLYWIPSLKQLPKNFDIYLCDGTYRIPAFAKMLGIIRGKIVDICGETKFYKLKTRQISGIKRAFYIRLLKNVDVFIAPSKMVEGFIKDILPKSKTILSYGFANPKLFPELRRKKATSPRLNSHNLLLIASITNEQRVQWKGIDILAETVSILKKSFPDVSLKIIGNYNPEIKNRYESNYPGLKFSEPIYQPVKLVTEIKNASLYVLPGRGDAFPSSVIEAMLGGLPAIVSEYTGTKEVTNKLGKQFVSPLNSKELAKRIAFYFNLKPGERKSLSRNSIKLALNFDKKTIISDFKYDLEKALS